MSIADSAEAAGAFFSPRRRASSVGGTSMPSAFAADLPVEQPTKFELIMVLPAPQPAATCVIMPSG
jgi:hypothetical protein